MLFIEKETVVPIDVDMTLIDYNTEGKDKRDLIQVGLVPGKEIWIYPIKEHIDQIKNFRAGNFYIIIWSGSGAAWAKHIIDKLGLTDYVDMIIRKPSWYVDDTPAEEWMKRLYRYPPYMRK